MQELFRHILHARIILNNYMIFLICIILCSFNFLGSVYIRWGRSQCPRVSTTLYSGIAAGARQSTKGNGANFICLTRYPSYMRFAPGGQFHSRIAPIEYHPSGNLMGYTWDKNAPCAACHNRRQDSLWYQEPSIVHLDGPESIMDIWCHQAMAMGEQNTFAWMNIRKLFVEAQATQTMQQTYSMLKHSVQALCALHTTRTKKLPVLSVPINS